MNDNNDYENYDQSYKTNAVDNDNINSNANISTTI